MNFLLDYLGMMMRKNKKSNPKNTLIKFMFLQSYSLNENDSVLLVNTNAKIVKFKISKAMIIII